MDKPIAPASVKRALEYINAELGSPLGISDIAAAAGVAGRTLFKHFKDAHGASPMQYLRNARFEKVHRALLCAEHTDNVSAIALRWGFSHLGRFAIEYRQRYGEPPSQTLTRSPLQTAK